MFNKKTFYFIFSLLTLISIFIYLFKNVSPWEVIQLIKEVDIKALIAFVVLSFSMSITRTWRYQVLLNASGYKPKNIALFLTVLVRNFFSDILPARIGTLIYIYITNTRLGVPLAAATSSFAFAFLFDMIAIVPIIIFALLFVSGNNIPKEYLIISSIVLLVISLIILIFLPKICKLIKAIIKSEKLNTTLSSIENDIIKLKESKIYTKILSLSILVRIFKYSSLYVFLYALLKPLGYTISNLPIAKIFLAICSSELAASLPIAAPGGFGLYEGAWALTFSLLGFAKDIASLTAISHHLFTQAYGYSLGGVALVILLLPYFKTKTLNKKEIRKKVLFNFFTKMIFFCVTSFVLIFILLSNNTHSETKLDLKLNTNSPNIKAKIYFDSNRSGSFGIYEINLEKNTLKQIIDTKAHEIYPYIKGDKLIYAKTLSLTRYAPTDVWIFNLKTKENKLLVKNANFPSFSEDGNVVFFERDRNKVMGYNLKTKKIKKIFPNKKSKFKNTEMVKPRIKNNILTFTSSKPSKWHAWYYDLNKKVAHLIEKGCEPSSHTNNKIVYIDKENLKGGSGIKVYNLNSKKVNLLHDRDDPLGHEYFPNLYDNYLLFSACPSSQHNHNNSNYQIFIKDLKTNITYQLTSDKYTNRWPMLILNH